jgi:uncharacterized coiled-coil DUF342 family protein
VRRRRRSSRHSRSRKLETDIGKLRDAERWAYEEIKSMEESRWQRLKQITWFREAQDEVMAYVEELRAELFARDAATAESIERMRTYFADGMGFKESVGGVEAMMLSLAVEAKAQREAHANVKKHYEELSQKYGKLEKEAHGLRGFKMSVDEALNSGDGVYRP